MRILCIFLLGLSYLHVVTSLDVSWIPSDPDGPLPLSAKYRDSLRKLCTLLDSGNPMPAELKEKKPTLVKMCKKLRSGDKNIAHSTDKISLKGWGGLILTGVLSYGCIVAWDKRRSIRRMIKSFMEKVTGSDKKEILRNVVDAQIAREARLKRFQQMQEAEVNEIVQLADTQ